MIGEDNATTGRSEKCAKCRGIETVCKRVGDSTITNMVSDANRWLQMHGCLEMLHTGLCVCFSAGPAFDPS